MAFVIFFCDSSVMVLLCFFSAGLPHYFYIQCILKDVVGYKICFITTKKKHCLNTSLIMNVAYLKVT